METGTKSSHHAGQSSVELILVLGFMVIPALAGGFAWIRTEWNHSECAFQTFKNARLELIRTQHAVKIGEMTLLPLEDLDRNKGGLSIADGMKEVSQLWEQAFSSSHSSPESDHF